MMVIGIVMLVCYAVSSLARTTAALYQWKTT